MLARSIRKPTGRQFLNEIIHTRQLTTSKRVWANDKINIPSVILDELRDTSKIAPSPKNGDTNKKILILDPSQTADRKFRRLVDLHSETDTHGKNLVTPINIFQDEITLGTSGDSINSSIDNLKPKAHEITITKYDSLRKMLSKSFTKSQLRDYINESYVQPSFSGTKKGISSINKDKLSRIIIEDIWLIGKSDKLSTLDDLLITNSVKLSKPELFLLLLQNGFILQYLSRVGVRVSFDTEHDKIKFTGTEYQVTNAEIILNLILNKAHKETLNLSTIKRLSLEKYNGFSLEKIGKNTEVYFNHLNNDNYELFALNENQIKKSKRLLLWSLNYNKHLREMILLPDNFENLEFVPYKDDDSLSWNNRHQNLFLLKALKLKEASNYMAEQLNKYSDNNLMNNDLNFEDLIENVKSLPVGKQKSDDQLEKESWKLLNDLGITFDNFEGEREIVSDECDGKPISKPANKPIQETRSQDKQHEFNITAERKDEIYNTLIDFSYRNRLNGLTEDKLNHPIFTVTLGNLLFENTSDSENKLIPTNPEFSLQIGENYKFNSNIQLVNDKVLSFPPYGNPSLNSQEINHYLNNDPHNYAIQLKFLPSPFLDDNKLNSKDIDSQMKYPPVEIWIELNEKSKPDIETMNIVTVEGENSCYISLPNEKSDMKVCCQLSGDVISQGNTDEVTEPQMENIEDILNATTTRYSRFASQPGVSEFLKNSKLDFSGRVATSIAPFIDLIINGETVRYHYINVSFRRQLDLNYGDAEDGRLVQFNVVEGGSLGGRKLEVNLVGDITGDLNKDQFDRLIDDSTKLISEL